MVLVRGEKKEEGTQYPLSDSRDRVDAACTDRSRATWVFFFFGREMMSDE